jgi:ribosome-binding factor A
MRPHRNLKVGSVIEHELSILLAREFELPGVLITVTSVDVATDLLHAKVRVAIIPYDKEIEAYEELQKKRARIEHAIYKKINIRQFPKFEFLIDSPAEKVKIKTRGKKKGEVVKW